jgi:predicted site-specific integrase-resolvase
MNGNYSFVPHRKACEFYGVSSSTIRRWANKNIIEHKRTPFNQRVYKISYNTNIIFTENKQCVSICKKYVYCRVSSSKQKDDLQRQCSYMSNKYPNHIIIKDIGSGLNYKRRGLLNLLELSYQGNVEELVISSRDRLCRFGFELIEWIFNKNNTKLVVLNASNKVPEQQFTEDILAILQVFACRWNGKRRYNNCN